MKHFINKGGKHSKNVTFTLLLLVFFSLETFLLVSQMKHSNYALQEAIASVSKIQLLGLDIISAVVLPNNPCSVLSVRSNVECVKLLLSSGGDHNRRDTCGR